LSQEHRVIQAPVQGIRRHLKGSEGHTNRFKSQDRGLDTEFGVNGHAHSLGQTGFTSLRETGRGHFANGSVEIFPIVDEHRCQPPNIQPAQGILNLRDDVPTTTDFADHGKISGVGPKPILGIPITACGIDYRNRALLGDPNNVLDVSITQPTAQIRHSVGIAPLGGPENEGRRSTHSTILSKSGSSVLP
jgi:hypothetical protein